MLMAADLPLPLVTGLSQSTQGVDQYIGFGRPAKPYSTAELAADLDKPVTVGPLSNVWMESVEDITEGGTARFLIRRSGSSGALQVNYRIDAISSAIPGKDFEEWGGVVTFAIGQQESTIEFHTYDDLIPESAESLRVQLFGIVDSNYIVASNSLTAMILDNDTYSNLPIVGFESGFQSATNSAPGMDSFQLTRNSLDVGSKLQVDVEFQAIESVIEINGSQLAQGQVSIKQFVFEPHQTSIVIPAHLSNSTQGVVTARVMASANIVLDLASKKELYLRREVAAPLLEDALDVVMLTADSGEQKASIRFVVPQSIDQQILIDDDSDSIADRSIRVEGNGSTTLLNLKTKCCNGRWIRTV